MSDDLLCATCNGVGFVVEEDADGNRVAKPCECHIQRAIVAQIKAAGLPPRYRRASLEEIRPEHPTQERALILARGYVREWPMHNGRGLFLNGPVGTGKTFLAVAILRALTLDKGARAVFRDVGQLLAQLRTSYRGEGAGEDAILRPLLRSELAILDELGAARATDWSSEMLERIISERYNNGLPTIVTSNYRIQPPRQPVAVPSNPYAVDAMRAAATPETLGDRLGARALSRVVEMCKVVPMDGPDRRMASLG